MTPEKPMPMRFPRLNRIFSLKNQAFYLARLYRLLYTAARLAQQTGVALQHDFLNFVEATATAQPESFTSQGEKHGSKIDD